MFQKHHKHKVLVLISNLFVWGYSIVLKKHPKKRSNLYEFVDFTSDVLDVINNVLKQKFHRDRIQNYVVSSLYDTIK